MARSIHPIVVGTAGHIDHGKSSLVRALTGIDPDRLKEEKERGLTIDLGFARLRLSDGRWLGFVDVPGHERFVRNMVAGATGLDLVLLVVAADDGVMPQTVEHVDILDLLQVRAGLIALTKVDMVDPALADMAAEEVRALVAGTPLADAPIVRTSVATGEGLDELRQRLEALALATPPRSDLGAFRMPIQRVFSLPGIGTVVTGIPQCGTVAPGDEVEILPLGERVKVRGIHAYGGKVERAQAGHSTALSVPDAKAAGVRRGMVVAAPGTASVGDALDVELRLTRRAPVLPHRAPIRCHTGTVEVRGDLLLLDRDRVGAGEAFVARLELDEPLSCAPGDRLLLRLQNPPATVGGGRVLRLLSSGRYRRQSLGAELAGLVAAGDRPEARIRHELAAAGPLGVPVDELARSLGAGDEDVLATVEAMPDVAVHRRTMRVFPAEAVAAGEAELLQSVERMLARRPEAASVQRTALRATRTLPNELIEYVFDRLLAAGRVRSGRLGQVLFVDRLRPLAPRQQALFDKIVSACETAGARPPALDELANLVGAAGDELASLVDRARDEGRIDKVGDHFYGGGVLRALLRAVRSNCLRHQGVLDIPQLRDELGTSRKYLIPLLEHVDALGLTVLREGVRRLLPSSDLARELAAEAP